MTAVTVRIRLKEVRESRGLTQVQLGELSGVRRATISDIENGKTSAIDFDVLEKLANALGVNAAVLVDHESKGTRGERGAAVRSGVESVTEPERQQMEKAERFVAELIVLAENDKMPALAAPSALYESAKGRVRAFIRDAGRGRPGGVPGPAIRYPKFTQWATQQLEEAGLTGELLEAAAAAVQALLVRELTTTRDDAITVYQRFERIIPYNTL